jgi:hypothetical protein
MRTLSFACVASFFILFSFSISEKREGFRGLASAWNLIPSRSLSGLHYIFKGFTYNEDRGTVLVSGPVIEITQGEKGGVKVFPEGFSLELDQEDFEDEQLLGQSIFQARSGSGQTVGTAFLVGKNLVLTNRHLLLETKKKKSWECGQFSILLNHKEENVRCDKIRFCSFRYDYCIVQMKKMASRLEIGNEVKPLRLSRWVSEGENTPLLHIGNASGLGLQASRGKGLRISQGEFHHFVPTLIGSSGAPIFDDKDRVIGINWAHTGRDFLDDQSFNRGILVSTIFNELKRTHPFTLREIRSFKSWSSREKIHRSVRVNSNTSAQVKR